MHVVPNHHCEWGNNSNKNLIVNHKMRKSLLKLVLCLVSVSMNAHSQDGFIDVVRDNKTKIERAIASVMPINIKKKATTYDKIGKFTEAVELYKKESMCRFVSSEYFIAGGDRYTIGLNPSENVVMTMSFVNSNGKIKTQKKKVADVTDYVCKKEIPVDR